ARRHQNCAHRIKMMTNISTRISEKWTS
ncbi:hypothetical protein GCK32_013558, partial [Trichostrongylus colubriformis]